MKRNDKSIEPKEMAAAMRIPRPQAELETETTMELVGGGSDWSKGRKVVVCY